MRSTELSAHDIKANEATKPSLKMGQEVWEVPFVCTFLQNKNKKKVNNNERYGRLPKKEVQGKVIDYGEKKNRVSVAVEKAVKDGNCQKSRSVKI